MWASGGFHGLFLPNKYKLGDWLNVYKCNEIILKRRVNILQSSPLLLLHTFPKHAFDLPVTNVTQLGLNTPYWNIHLWSTFRTPHMIQFLLKCFCYFVYLQLTLSSSSSDSDYCDDDEDIPKCEYLKLLNI